MLLQFSIARSCPDNSMKKLTILITDDHKLVRENLALLLNDDPRFSVIAVAGSGEEAVELVPQLNPDIVLMDINLPGIDGIEATRQIIHIAPATRIIGLSMQALLPYYRKMIRNGARGYVVKSSSFAELCSAIIAVHQGEVYMCKSIREDNAGMS
jgi:DNA-binding NarL/FixJ family response regulator